MSKRDMQVAIALYILCLLASWSWVLHRIHPLSFYMSIFSLFLTAFAFYAMWRIVQHVAKHTGWNKIGIVSIMEPRFMALRYPVYMQGILDINFISALVIAEYFDGFQRMFLILLDICIIFFISRKWHTFYKTRQISKLRSL